MADTPGAADGSGVGRGFIKSPLDLAGGLFLIAIATIGYVGAFSLPFGSLSSIGAGLLPKSIAILVGVFGFILVLISIFSEGEPLEAWGLRGIIFVIGSVIVFALTIRTLGLFLAGPLTIMVSGFADKDTKPVELFVFSLFMTAMCWLLFKYLLQLPIPIFPPGYELF